ncbi:MAG: CPBP family intramembrane glutamic endopeptidase [Candidatus Omnitrophota bacterium]
MFSLKPELKKVITYTILVYALSVIGYTLLLKSKTIGLNPFIAMFILMWCPALSAFITQLVYQKNLRGFGWGMGSPKWYLVAYFLPLLSGALAYAVIWLTGLGIIDPGYKFNLFHLVIIGTLFNFAYAAGEEIGWRGLLVPSLYKVTGYTKTCFISGIIWAVWHFPIIIGGAYLADIPLTHRLILFILIVIAGSFIINWLRLRSGSVWVPILFHASANLYLQRLFQPMTKLTGQFSRYVAGESGIALLVVYAVVGFVFWRMRGKLAK